MRVLEYTDLEQRVVEGTKGNLTALEVVSDEAFGVGLRVVPPHSKVPKPGLPYARGRRVLFALRGHGTVSNGEYYETVAAGKFVTLEDGESPSFATQGEELVLLEVRYHEGGKILPPTVALTMPVSVDVRAPRKATSYDAVD